MADSSAETAIDVAAFDALSPGAAQALLRPVCASGAWMDALVSGRPYGSLDDVIARSDAVLDTLNDAGIAEALAAHPRIGERAAGNGRESAWSREEQAAASARADDTSAALVAGNVAYEQRFGRVFLICATGRSADEVLAELHRRLDHDDATERETVRRELAAIVRLRLAKALR